MQRLILTILLAFAVMLAIGPIMIPWLKRLKVGQTIYNLGPQSHMVKQGTPTMGGIMIVLVIAVVSLIMTYEDKRWDFLLVTLLVVIAHGIIGFMDDYIKVVKKQSLGLTAWQKIVLQWGVALVLAIWAYFQPMIGSRLIVPFFNVEWELGVLYIPLVMIGIIFIANSANLLDGADGLLSSCGLVSFATLALICLFITTSADKFPVPYGVDPGEYVQNIRNLTVLCGAAVGTLMGFLRFNSFPAKVMMGDTGSMAIGGGVVAVAIMTRLPILLVLIAAPMIASSVSVMMQVAYFKITHGKRIFRMSPLHHHFELGGTPETKIVALYMIVNVLLCLVALLGLGM